MNIYLWLRDEQVNLGHEGSNKGMKRISRLGELFSARGHAPSYVYGQCTVSFDEAFC